MSQHFGNRLLQMLPRIVGKFGTPFHIYDEQGIRETLRGLKTAFTNQNLGFQEYYAVKALPVPAIMDIIHTEGCGFDCSSIRELRLARAAGATPEDIMFTSNNTSQEEFDEALSNGGCILNLDDEIFVSKLGNRMPELICFRLNPGSRKTGTEVNSIIGNPLESKYGVPIERIVTAYSLAQKAGARRFGLHTMVCSNDRDYLHMLATVKLLFEVAGDLFMRLGIRLEFINMGGGVGIPYRPDENEFDMQSLAQECRVLANTFRHAFGYVPKLFMESGRYVTGPHGVLVNRVINVYQKYLKFAGVQAAMPALMRVGMYATGYHHCTVVDSQGLLAGGPREPITIAGPICENCDVLARQMELPRIVEGDHIITHDTGAHGTAMTFNYNGRTRVQELLADSMNNVRRVCREETVEDLAVRYQGLEGEEHVLHIDA